MLGSGPPYAIEYQIESPSGTSLNLYPFGKPSPHGDQYPRLYWEAADSVRFFDEVVKNRSGFLEGTAPLSFQVHGVPMVVPAIGRLMVLAPGSPLPAPEAPFKGVLLAGTASAFRVVFGQPPAPPSGITIR